MGISASLLNWLDGFVASVPRPVRIAEYGDQDCPHGLAGDYYKRQGHEHLAFDISGRRGSVAIDLGRPIPAHYAGRFNVVTNFGTIEHINDQYHAWRNLHLLCAPGGVMVHVLNPPGQWPGHGRYYHDEHFVEELAAQCGYEILNMHREDFYLDRPLTGLVCVALRRGTQDFPSAEQFAQLPMLDTGDLTSTGDYLSPPRPPKGRTLSTGVLFVAYDLRPFGQRQAPLAGDFVEELGYSVHCARRLGLPIALLLESDARLALDLGMFDQVVTFDGDPFRATGVHHFMRKYLMFELSPFELTLYLDSDAFVITEEHPVHADWPLQAPPAIDGFDYPFAMAERHGLAMAYDGYHLGRLEKNAQGHVIVPYDQFARAVDAFLPGQNYVGLLNGGVIFFRKNAPGLAEMLAVAKKVSLAANCDDQTGITVACELTGFPVCRLYDRTWNCRNHFGPYLPWWGARIMHNPGWYHEFMRAFGGTQSC